CALHPVIVGAPCWSERGWLVVPVLTVQPRRRVLRVLRVLALTLLCRDVGVGGGDELVGCDAGLAECDGPLLFGCLASLLLVVGVPELFEASGDSRGRRRRSLLLLWSGRVGSGRGAVSGGV